MTAAYSVIFRCLFFCACASAGCSAVFDRNADDIEVIDDRRDPRTLWQQPTGFYGFGERLTADFVREEPHVAPFSPENLLPLVKGLDGKLYWPFQGAAGASDDPATQFAFRLYQLPSGALVHSSVADLYSWVSPTDALSTIKPHFPDQPGSLTLFTVGGATIREQIPATSVISKWPTASEPVLTFCDPAVTPHTVQVRFYEDHRLSRKVFPWPSVLRDKPAELCVSFYWLVDAKAFIFEDDTKNLWLLQSDGTETNLGPRMFVHDWPDKVLYYQEDTSEFFIYSLLQHKSFPLGVFDSSFRWSKFSNSSWLLFCEDNGLRSVSIEPPQSPAVQHVIDPAPCVWIRDAIDGRVYYDVIPPGAESTTDSGMRIEIGYVAPVDGSAPPEPDLSVSAQIPIAADSFELSRCANGLRAYAMNLWHDHGVKRDGWVENWRFSEEAYDVSFSRDCRRVRWKEDVDRNLGTLYSATIPDGRPLRLARNAARYFEQPDGRVLVEANLIGIRDAEQLLLIDEDAQQAHWLLDGTFLPQYAKEVPALNELLITVPDPSFTRLDAAAPTDWYRLPLPPRGGRS